MDGISTQKQANLIVALWGRDQYFIGLQLLSEVLPICHTRLGVILYQIPIIIGTTVAAH